jgi:hypothetical protein
MRLANRQTCQRAVRILRSPAIANNVDEPMDIARQLIERIE